jgi:Arc/MetJ-type ribon-helix-helix transcriptional regulator
MIRGESKTLLKSNRKRNLTVAMGTPYFERMDVLLNDGLYTCQAEIVKDALRRLFSHYELKIVTE